MIIDLLKNFLKSRKIDIYNNLYGNNLSTKLGDSGESFTIKEYQYGDKVSKINWKMSSKLNKTFVNISEEERGINIVIAIILNGSINFGKDKTKKILMSEIYDLIGKSSLKYYNSFKTILFSNNLNLYNQSSNLSSLYNNINYIKKFNSLGKKANYNSFIETFIGLIKDNSLVYLISDFIGDINLKRISKHNQIISIIVRDKLEENPNYSRDVKFMDMENSSTQNRNISKQDIIDYKYAIEENDEKLLLNFKKERINYIKIFTDEDPLIKFSSYI